MATIKMDLIFACLQILYGSHWEEKLMLKGTFVSQEL